MDNLQNLPQKDTSSTPQEEAIMENFFGPTEQGSRFSKINWKIVGAASALFLALANPWIDQILCKVPYCGGSPTTSLITKLVLFIIVLALLEMFL